MWNVASSVILKTEHLLPLFESHTYIYICTYMCVWGTGSMDLTSVIMKWTDELGKTSVLNFILMILLPAPFKLSQEVLNNWNDQSLFHKRFWSKYITGHKISFEIQSIFPSSPNYETMAPCLFEKEKKTNQKLLVLFFRRRTVQKKPLFLWMHKVKK